MAEMGDSLIKNPKELNRKFSSPVTLLILSILGVFTAELFAMAILNVSQIQPYWLDALIDAFIMIIIAFPVFYFFPFRALITELEQRRRSEALLNKVLENLPVGVWITDSKGKIVRGNLAGQKIWAGAHYVGIEQYGEYKGWWVESGKLIEPEQWAAARAILHGETSINEEVEIECFDGSHKIILNSAIPIFDQDTLQGTIIVNADITERKQAEQSLKEREALFSTAFETMPLGIWLTDDEGKIIYANPAVKQIWEGALYVGVERYGEYKGWWVNSGRLIEPEEWASFRAATKGETSLNEEIEIECFDGTHKFILNSAIPVRDEAGKILNVFVINQDITRRKRMELELTNTNELLERYFSSIHAMIAYLDREFNFIRVNEAYARIGGHPVEFFIGQNHFDLYPNEENHLIFQQVVESGVPFSVQQKPFEYPEFPERGVTYWDWSVQPVMGSDKQVSGLVLSLVDVTERMRAEQQLERQNQELRELTLTAHRQRQLAEGLTQAAIALNSSLELESVLDAILEQLRRSVPFTMAAITLIEEDSLRVVRYTGLENYPETAKAVEVEYPLRDYLLLAQITSEQQPVYIEDIQAYPDWPPIPGMEWIRSYIAVPLIIAGQVRGLINLTSDQPGAFSQETVTRLMAFVAPAAVAIQNARLYAAEAHARQVAEAMSAMSLALNQTLDLDKVLETFLDYLPSLVSYDGAYIATLDDEARLTLRALDGYEAEASPKRMVGTSFDTWEIPYIQEVISKRKSLLIRDTRGYTGWETLVTRAEIRSWMGVPILLGDKVIGVLGMMHAEAGLFNEEHLHFVESVAAQVSVAIQNAWLFEQVRAGHERFQSLSRRLVEVQESERRYIARELHDETSQALTAIMFGLRILEQEVNHPEQLLPQVTELKRLTEEVLENLHRLAMNLRPASLDHLGLVPALEQLVKDVANRYALNIHFKSEIGEEEGRLPEHVETALYRIVQEALTNTARHASARNVDVILELQEGEVFVLVEDDGVGFDPNTIGKGGKLGLVGMQERAQMMGGSLQIESSPGRGTTIVVEVTYGNSHLDR